MNFGTGAGSRVAATLMRLARACMVCAILGAASLANASPAAATDEGVISDPAAPVVICAALICTHPFGLYDYYTFLPAIEAASAP